MERADKSRTETSQRNASYHRYPSALSNERIREEFPRRRSHSRSRRSRERKRSRSPRARSRSRSRERRRDRDFERDLYLRYYYEDLRYLDAIYHSDPFLLYPDPSRLPRLGDRQLPHHPYCESSEPPLESAKHHHPNQIRAPLPNPIQDSSKKVFLNRHYVPPSKSGEGDHQS